MIYYFCVSYVLIGNTEGDVMETILFATQFSIPKIALCLWSDIMKYMKN